LLCFGHFAALATFTHLAAFLTASPGGQSQIEMLKTHKPERETEKKPVRQKREALH
jgi:hypothetical protein